MQCTRCQQSELTKHSNGFNTFRYAALSEPVVGAMDANLPGNLVWTHPP